MNIDHYENDPKQPPTAQSLVEGEVNALVTFWPDICDDDTISSDVAFDLLAIWAHLRRFDVASLDEFLGESLTALLSRDKDAIIDAAMRNPFPVDWAEVADRIDETWDQVTDDDDIANLEDAINEHFESLDRASLVAYAVGKLDAARTDNDRLEKLVDTVELGEEYLADHPDVFLPAAVMASSMLDSYRHDLHEADEQLWETTLKHRSLQELIDEQQNPCQLPKIDSDTVDSPDADPPNTVLPASHSRETAFQSTDYATAAGEKQPFDVVIDELADESVQESGTSDYRIAWAHFLAAMYRGTPDRDDWRIEFLSLTSTETERSLDSKWRERIANAKKIVARNPDWKRQYKGNKVFKLEPEILKNELELRRFLHELTEST